MRLTIKGKLPTLNEHDGANRANRYLGAKLKREATANVFWQIKAQRKRKLKGRYFYRLTWYCENERTDPDNIEFAKKYIFDGLIEAGIIENDGWKQVAGTMSFFRIGEPRVEIQTHRADEQILILVEEK